MTLSTTKAGIFWNSPPKRRADKDHPDLGATALSDRCDELGPGQDYIGGCRLTVFTAVHHLRYYAELLLGQEISVTVHLLERSSKVIHAMAFWSTARKA
ncbi:MAG: hypothetical protein H7288_04330 [Kineosporiaceae bacterium]|nr:hypothetical protein [Aeromicrobium sp.]